MFKKWMLAAMLVFSLAAVAACGGDDDGGDTAAPAASSAAATSEAAPATSEAAATTEEAAATTEEAPATSEEAASSAAAPASELDGSALDGKTVKIAGPETDSEAEGFQAALDAFADPNGGTVEYAGSRDFETQISLAIESGQTPDIAIFPQPGKIQDFADKIPGLPDDIKATVAGSFDQYWSDLVTSADGRLLGVPNKSDLKSLVWYSPKAFADKGYTVPTTWDEFTALQEQIVADGGVPWCIGVESGDATGWAFTDWVEDFMLRMKGPDVYDQWVKHEIPFNDPQVKEVVQAVADIWFKDGYVLQARDEIATTSFADAGKPLLDGECFLHRQANFYAANWEDEGAAIGPDADVNAFYLPPMNDQFGKPVLGAGTYAVALNDKPETLAMMRYLASTEYIANRIAAKKGGFLSANKNQDTSLYGTDIERTFAQILAEGSPFRFDASDLMPGAVGAGSFWKDGTSFITGAEDIDTMLNNIEASWPK